MDKRLDKQSDNLVYFGMNLSLSYSNVTAGGFYASVLSWQEQFWLLQGLFCCSQFDQDKYLLNAEEKTVNLKTGETYEPKPEDLITKKSQIKQITGGDRITARFLYGEFFEFIPTFKIFMATNHKPKISGGDNGIWRRIKFIPFTVIIPEEKRDRNLTDKLMAENSGILNWLLEGYRLWKKEGLKEPEAIRTANEEYRFDMDSVGSFVAECLNIDASQKERLLNGDLYSTYTKWCERNNESVMSHRKLSSKMREKNYQQLASNGSRWWLGLSIKEEWRA